MLDFLMIAGGVAFFAVAILYVLACEKMWGGYAGRLYSRRDRDDRDHGLSRLCADQPRAVL